MAVKNEGFPDLERYLEERGRHLVTYTEGATMYHIPYYSFVRLAKEAGANLPLHRTTVIDIDVIEEYLKENPDVADRVNLVSNLVICQEENEKDFL